MQLIFFKVLIKLTRHRGVFHTIPMGIFLGQITIILFYYSFHFDTKFSTIAGIFLFFGFCVHLLLDEFASIDARGFKVKKSFGTAFKLFDSKNVTGTLFLYILIGILYSIIPTQTETYYNIYEILKNIQFI